MHHLFILIIISKRIISSFLKLVKDITLTVILILLCSQSVQAKCTGRFANPITDVCWECIFPISIGGVKLFSSDNPDTDNPSLPICACGVPVPRVGFAAGFWEPVRLVDVTKTPFCFPNLGGIEFNPGVKVGTGSVSRSSSHGTSSWHIHWYAYPLLYWLELLVDFACLESAPFDLAYITELDPMWQDDDLTFILNPEAVLFGNPAAQAACAADCVASSAAKPLDSLFWCAGCQGSMYPLSGNIQAHTGSIQSGLLAVERFTYKLHRELIEWGTSGEKALCQRYPMPVMKKSQYRAQLTVPVPSTCYPYGKSTTFFESGKEIPIVGEDFGFLVWRKRNCCVF
ncbi:MAG: conjugal transfer protein [Candidatus Midichloriaceae bacterium]|jgi:conjugal transfer pilus assembly protein TraU|nr:conjugal transfer protein [Candidatus Midichloriaceae bacterium]